MEKLLQKGCYPSLALKILRPDEKRSKYYILTRRLKICLHPKLWALTQSIRRLRSRLSGFIPQQPLQSMIFHILHNLGLEERLQ